MLRATAELLVEQGAAGVTIEGVAERSGVAKTTIYRHWKSRSQLIFDGFESLFTSATVTQYEGSIREQLEALLTGLVRGLTESQWAPAVAALIEAGDRDAELRQLVHDFLAVRMESGKAAVRAAVTRGELKPGLDTDVALSLLVGPVFYRRLVSRESLDAEFIARVVGQFLAGAAT